MDFNFDEVIDRLGTNSTKWEMIAAGGARSITDRTDPRHGPDQLLPMWVADMDFRTVPEVIQALTARAQHGVFGYTFPTDSYYTAVIDWMQRHYGRTVEKEWIVLTPGVIPALNVLVETFVQPGEKVLIQRPVYHPFFSAIENNRSQIVSNSLIYQDGRYCMDFEDLAQKAADPAVKMAILCNPHNPIGRAWTRDELTRFGQICLENDVLVVADEIHCDLIMPGHTFTSFAAVCDEFAARSAICTAPSKTFNLPGLKNSNIVVPNPDLRRPFQKTLHRHAIHGGGIFGLLATEVAYTHGEAWLAAVLDYIAGNYRYLVDFMAEHLPQIGVAPLEGTYLVWADFSALGMEADARTKWLMETVKLYTNAGRIFGPEGEDFERINIACARSLLVEAMQRLQQAVDDLEK